VTQYLGFTCCILSFGWFPSVWIFKCQLYGTLCPFHLHRCCKIKRWNRQCFLKSCHIKVRFQWITQHSTFRKWWKFGFTCLFVVHLIPLLLSQTVTMSNYKASRDGLTRYEVEGNSHYFIAVVSHYMPVRTAETMKTFNRIDGIPQRFLQSTFWIQVKRHYHWSYWFFHHYLVGG
jgi:hypothetical protein